MKELSDVFVKWRIAGLPEKEIEVLEIADNAEGLSIRLGIFEGTERVGNVEIRFVGHVAYRNMDELYKTTVWESLSYQAVVWPPRLYMIQDSTWIRRLTTEAGGVLDSVPLVHYGIFSGSDCVDVASQFPPRISFHSDAVEQTCSLNEQE